MRSGISTAFRIGMLLCNILGTHRDSILKIIGMEHAEAIDNVITACNALHMILAPFMEGN